MAHPAGRQSRIVDGNHFFAQQRSAEQALKKIIINTAAHLATDYADVEVWFDGNNAPMSPDWSLNHATRNGIVFG